MLSALLTIGVCLTLVRRSAVASEPYFPPITSIACVALESGTLRWKHPVRLSSARYALSPGVISVSGTVPREHRDDPVTRVRRHLAIADGSVVETAPAQTAAVKQDFLPFAPGGTELPSGWVLPVGWRELREEAALVTFVKPPAESDGDDGGEDAKQEWALPAPRLRDIGALRIVGDVVLVSPWISGHESSDEHTVRAYRVGVDTPLWSATFEKRNAWAGLGGAGVNLAPIGKNVVLQAGAQLRCVRVADGREIWKCDLTGALPAHPRTLYGRARFDAAGDRILVSHPHLVACLSIATGATAWQLNPGGTNAAVLVVDDCVVLALSAEATLANPGPPGGHGTPDDE